MFMFCQKFCLLNAGFIVLALTSTLPAAPARQLANRSVQRRFMWKEMDSSMDNIMDGMMTGARAITHMLGGMLPTSRVSAGYRSNTDSLPTSTVRVRYIVRQPISTSTHTKYRLLQPTRMPKEFKPLMHNASDKYKGARLPLHYIDGIGSMPHDVTATQSALAQSKRKTTATKPASNLIIGRNYNDWLPIPQRAAQQHAVASWNNTNMPPATAVTYGESLPAPEQLIATTTAPTTYEVTELTADAHVNNDGAATAGSFLPMRSSYQYNEIATPMPKGYSERLRNSKLASWQHTQRKPTRYTSIWLPYLSSTQRPAKQEHAYEQPAVVTEQVPLESTTTTSATPTTVESQELVRTADAHANNYGAATAAGYGPMRSSYQYNEIATPKPKVYSERLRSSKLASWQHTQRKPTRYTSIWLPYLSSTQRPAKQEHAYEQPAVETEEVPLESTTTTRTTPATVGPTSTAHVQATASDYTAPPVARRIRYKTKELTKRGSIKFGDRLTDI